MVVLTFAPCSGGVFLPSTGANTPLAHVVSTCCNLHRCFSIHQLAQILHVHTWWSSPIATCAGCVFPATGTHAPLALCGGGCMWWLHVVVACGGASCIFVAVVVVYVKVAVAWW